MTVPQKVPEWLIERLFQGELSPEKEQELRQRLAGEEDAFFLKLKESNRDILDRYPKTSMTASILQRAQEQAVQRPRNWLVFAVPAFAALLALFLVYPFAISNESSTNSGKIEAGFEVTRNKGLQPLLRLHRKQGNLAERLEPGNIVFEHDVLQISYNAAGKRYGVIFSIDGRGVLTQHFPEVTQKTAALLSPGEVALAHAYELDDAPRFERFFLVSSNTPFGIESVLQAGHFLAKHPGKSRTQALRLPPTLEQVSFLVKKDKSQ